MKTASFLFYFYLSVNLSPQVSNGSEEFLSSEHVPRVISGLA